MGYDIEYYQKKNGDIPVMDFLLSLQPKIRAKAYSEIELLKKYGKDLREPYVKPIKGIRNKGIYELRIRFSSNILRIFYFAISKIHLYCYMDLLKRSIVYRNES